MCVICGRVEKRGGAEVIVICESADCAREREVECRRREFFFYVFKRQFDNSSRYGSLMLFASNFSVCGKRICDDSLFF